MPPRKKANPEELNQSASTEVTEASQTETEKVENAAAPLEEPTNSENPQTESELNKTLSDDAANPPPDISVPSSASELDEIEQGDDDASAKEASKSQDETENPEDGAKSGKNRTTSKKVTKKTGATEPEEPSTQSDTEDEPKSANPRRSKRIVSIDERRTVETDRDRAKNDLLELVESLKGKRILTGTIQGVERSPDNPDVSFAVIYHGSFKVIIPAEEAVEPPEDTRGYLPSEAMHYILTKRLGAEIDYIIKGIDEETGLAAGSRFDAMAMKRKEYYLGTDRDGNYLLHEGVNAEARIISVIRTGVFVELFGVETFIGLAELSYQRWLDAALYFQPGQRTLVRILSIDRSNRKKIAATASVKQATGNPFEAAIRKYAVGSMYVGTVSMVDVSGVFVAMDGGIDCLCMHPKRGRPPRGSRVTVKIHGIDKELTQIWGSITHMAITV